LSTRFTKRLRAKPARWRFDICILGAGTSIGWNWWPAHYAVATPMDVAMGDVSVEASIGEVFCPTWGVKINGVGIGVGWAFVEDDI
jgi:hypothetical protein